MGHACGLSALDSPLFRCAANMRCMRIIRHRMCMQCYHTISLVQAQGLQDKWHKGCKTCDMRDATELGAAVVRSRPPHEACTMRHARCNRARGGGRSQPASAHARCGSHAVCCMPHVVCLPHATCRMPHTACCGKIHNQKQVRLPGITDEKASFGCSHPCRARAGALVVAFCMMANAMRLRSIFRVEV